MYLESLKLHGFKSFGRKTKIDFTDGLTAIVGPNGCGKSNILDALRWVLGEQKAGFLRSERMENVIFNGSKTIRPLGMAEVSLTIQNTKNILPIEFSEVVITRRLFRSSESQYLLNNAPCRLKDIQNLFMDTGIGSNAYSIIELSMVESILSGKPEERRHIIEEAAGVTKYKMRRKAAFRKLEATEADLQRLSDIISEIEKNVASLKRQVRKAQKFQEIKQELQEKEISLAIYKFSKIQEELQPLKQRLIESQNRREALASRFDSREAEIESLRVELVDIEKQLSTQQNAFNELSLSIQKKEEEILVARERRNALGNSKEKLLRERAEIKGRLEKTHAQIGHTEEKLQQLFESIQEAELDHQEKHVHLKSAGKKVLEKKAELKRLEDERVELLGGLAESKKEEERVKTQIENLTERLDAVTRQIEESEMLDRIREEKLAQRVEDKAQSDAQLAGLNKQHEHLLAQIETLGRDKDTLREKNLDRKGELQAVRERIALLRKFLESYEDYPEGVQHLLRNNYLNGGCKGTLAEVLNVEAKYRLAIEAALGEAAVSLVVDDLEQALDCIEVLKHDAKGAVTFLPLERFRKFQNNHETIKQRLKEQNASGVIDWASNLVNCVSDFRPLVESLLSDYLIVSDIEYAKRQSQNLQDQHVNLVTLNGEIISTWGPIKGGVNGFPEAGIIGRKALVEELEKKLATLNKKLQRDEKVYQAKEQRHQAALAEEQALAGKIKQAEARTRELEVELAQINYELKKERENRERIKKERDKLIEDRALLEQELRSLSPSLNTLDENKHQFDSLYEKIYDELTALERQVTEQYAVSQDSRVKLVGLKGDEKKFQEEIARLQEFAKELNGNAQRIDEEIHAATTEFEALEKRMAEVKAFLHDDFEKRHALENTVHQIEHEFLLHKQTIEEKEKALKGLRIERDAASEDFHALELRVSELRREAEIIKDRIKEDYNFNIKQAPVDETFEPEQAQLTIEELKNRIDTMGPVNLLALNEYEKEKSRLDFLTTQRDDLITAEANLNETIRVINKTAREQFLKVFEDIQTNFVKVFAGFFENGKATLTLEPDADPLEANIIIQANPKGRRLEALTLLSSGEKALTAISLLFAIYLVKPSPFCILDEVDAPLDDMNIRCFNEAIRKFSTDTQFIVITHNKLTMQAA
ncbi:MAG: chromosome segregation protein SMC, partial [bacterium]